MPALAAVDQALAETSELSRAVRGLLRIGFVLTTEGPALSRLAAAFQARYPACEVRLQEVETFDAYRALRRGDIDVLCNWLAVDEPDLTAGAVFAYYQRALAVAPSHRLAGQTTVSIEDLADEEVALLPPSTPSAVYDLLVPPRTPSGRPIRRTQPVQTINEILSLVARGRIVHPTSSTVPIFDRDDVVLIPIDDLPPLPLGLVWCTSRENPRIRALDLAGQGGGEAFNAGGGQPHRVRDVVDLICRLAGGGLTPEIRGDGTPPGEIDRQWVDPTKLRELTGWAPEVSLEEGLARTIAWYRDHPRALGLLL